MLSFQVKENNHLQLVCYGRKRIPKIFNKNIKKYIYFITINFYLEEKAFIFYSGKYLNVFW